MLPRDFAKVRRCRDYESACHTIFNEAIDKWGAEGRRALTEGQLTVICVETFFGEVCNGGIEQYLGNRSGFLARYGPDALRRVGLPAYAVILEGAMKRCLNTPERNEFGEMEDCFESPVDDDDDGDGVLEPLDDQFFKLYESDKNEFRERLFAYIIEHESEFTLEANRTGRRRRTVKTEKSTTIEKPKPLEKRVYVTERALVQRIRRRLKPVGGSLRKMRPAKVYVTDYLAIDTDAFGCWLLVDERGKAFMVIRDGLEGIASDIGVLEFNEVLARPKLNMKPPRQKAKPEIRLKRRRPTRKR